MQKINKNSWYKQWTLLPIFFVLILISIFAKRLADVSIDNSPSYIPTVLINTPIPNINLPPLPNRGSKLTSDDLKKEISLLNFWGSWCVACVIEHPILMKIAEQKIIPIHGIAWRDAPQNSIKWLEKNGDPYSLVGQDPNSKAAIAFGVTGAPETFIIGDDGVILYKYTGPISEKVWKEEFLPLISTYR